MPTPMNWPTNRFPVRRATRSRWWLIVGIAVFVVLIGSQAWLSYYVNALWFDALGYAEVFWTGLGIRSGIFTGFTAATFLILYGTFLGLKRAYLPGMPGGHTILVNGEPIRLPVERVLQIGAGIASLLIAIVTGAVMTSSWPTLALYWYAPAASGGPADPIFGRSVDFYLLTLPAWQLIAGWLLVLAVIACAAGAFFLLITGGARALQGLRGGHNPLSWRGFSLTVAFLLLVIAWMVYLGRFEELMEDHTIFGGVNYTDTHVILPGLLAIVAALVFGALIAIVNTLWAKRGRWLALAVAPALAGYLILQVVGWYVSTFVVKPNELVRERPYIAHNIALTRQAYGLDQVSRHEFPAEANLSAADPAANQATIQNIRLWDWRALQDTLRQIQEIRTYYDFPDIDIDRYEINGQMREVMLAARELNVDKLPGGSRNWINEKLIYTHGYGVTMNPVNGFTPEGLPTLLLSNMPVESTVPGLSVTRPEIYFGELTNSDVYVKTGQKEFNYPQGQSNNYTEYAGTGGIPIGSMLRRILIAMARGDLSKLPFSDDVTRNSRLLMRRNVRARVAALAPFLTYEQDPYIVVGENGRLYWIIDAFTTSDSYPYSTHYDLDGTSINYMRNSVKAVVDAYDGTVTFYVFEPNDPIIRTYRRIFPTLFKDADTMPEWLRRHVRYPELLLSVQAEVYGLYHMTDPEVFYNREDLWTVASEVGTTAGGTQATQPMQPNFVLMKLPGESSAEFVEILPFTPVNRNNLIGWIAGRSDGPSYGKSVVYDFPKTKLVDGPLQVEARIDQNAQLSGQLTLWNQQGSHARRGNLLVIPIGHALLYAEPIYLQAEQSPMPELRLVVLALQDQLAYGPTFESAVAALFGGAPSSLSLAPSSASSAQAAPEAGGKPSAGVKGLIARAAKDLSDYQQLTSQGKLGEAGQKLDDLRQTLNELKSQQK